MDVSGGEAGRARGANPVFSSLLLNQGIIVNGLFNRPSTPHREIMGYPMFDEGRMAGSYQINGYERCAKTLKI